MDDGSTPGAHLARKAPGAAGALSASWRPASVDAEARTAEIVFAAGGDVTRHDPFSGENFVERLNVEGADLARLRANGPLLDSHLQAGVRSQLGTVDAAWTEAGQGVARVRFSERHADVFEDVIQGIVKGASVGYQVNRVRELDEMIDGIPVRLVEAWTPFEVSLTPIPADAGAQVRAHTNSTAGVAPQKEINPMENETRGAPPVAAVNKAVIAERERTTYINTMCDKLHLPEALKRELIDGDVPLREAQDRVINAAADLADETEVDGHIEPGTGKREADFVAIAAEAVLHRTGVKRTENQDALALAQRDFLEAVGRAACSMEGRSVPPTASRVTLAERAIATSTLPAVVEMVAHRSAQVGYEAAAPSFKQFASMKKVTSYQPIRRVKLSDAPELEDVLEGADYPTGTLTDRVEISGLVKGGKILEFTEEMLMADDLGVLTDAPRMLGLAAARREADLFFQVLIDNGALSDTRDIFNGTDANTAIAAPSAAAFLAARQHLFSQTTENGAPLGLEPEWVVCGGDLRDDVERLLAPSTSYSTSTSTDVLPESFKDRATLIVEPRVPAGVVWFFSANVQVEHMEYYLLDGTNGPYVRREEGFRNDTIALKITSPFQAACLDRRGVYQLTGS